MYTRPLSSIKSQPQAMMKLILPSLLSLLDTPSTLLCHSRYSVNSVFTFSGSILISIQHEARDLLGWSCRTLPWVLGPSLPAWMALLRYLLSPPTVSRIRSQVCALHALHPSPPPGLWPHPPNSAPGTPASSFSLCLLCDLFLSLTLAHRLPPFPSGLSCLSLCAWRDWTGKWFTPA